MLKNYRREDRTNVMHCFISKTRKIWKKKRKSKVTRKRYTIGCSVKISGVLASCQGPLPPPSEGLEVNAWYGQEDVGRGESVYFYFLYSKFEVNRRPGEMFSLDWCWSVGWVLWNLEKYVLLLNSKLLYACLKTNKSSAINPTLICYRTFSISAPSKMLFLNLKVL